MRVSPLVHPQFKHPVCVGLFAKLICVRLMLQEGFFLVDQNETMPLGASSVCIPVLYGWLKYALDLFLALSLYVNWSGFWLCKSRAW